VVVGSPRRFGGWRMIEGREEEEFMCKVAYCRAPKGSRVLKGRRRT
jgi:hypothetical protein